MGDFNVLDPALPLFRSTFLEASAGTGKTFAIEHLVVRMLLSPEGPLLPQILVVTFTKAAVQELQGRIRACLKQCLRDLDAKSSSWPYLEVIFAEGEKATASAKKKILRALAHYEEASIFTIHGFCFEILRETAFLTDFLVGQQKETGASNELEGLARDYLRTEMASTCLTPLQFDILLRHYRGSFKDLVAKLSSRAAQTLRIEGVSVWKKNMLTTKKSGKP